MWCIMCGWSVSDDGGSVACMYLDMQVDGSGVVFLVRHRSRGEMYVVCSS